jgi:hypothetical protein
MGSERLRNTLFESQHFCGIIGVFLAAFIAPNHQTPGESGSRRVGIGFTEGNSVPEGTVDLMKAMVFADYHAAILASVPDRVPPKDVAAIGCGGNQRCGWYSMPSL